MRRIPPVRALTAALAPATAAAAALTLALVSVPASSAQPQERTRPSATPEATYATSALAATNAARTRNQLKALDADGCLKRFAGRQARAMASQQSMYHQDLGAIMRTCGLVMAGENVAVGYSSGTDVVRGWMGSPGHRANILNRGYRIVAVAARAGADGQWYSAQVFGRR
ncbi:CAP domain-containing protein [Nocardioides currus]|uniref:SCP domain-containing protein n=1 Tax=Nocardioides currus TaxID=2133958 RepID=A0A2R7YX10_9ACTN|nr:CAP domain-containing protein [Nocardioides currus]PUA80863.1 hypothetical protein C7S10_10655 [Nocardioides currus]